MDLCKIEEHGKVEGAIDDFAAAAASVLVQWSLWMRPFMPQ